MNRLAPPLLLAGLLCAGLAHAGAPAHVTASHAWIRVLPGKLPAGAYVVLRNDGDRPVLLTGASSPAYGEAICCALTAPIPLPVADSRMSVFQLVTINRREQDDTLLACFQESASTLQGYREIFLDHDMLVKNLQAYWAARNSLIKRGRAHQEHMLPLSRTMVREYQKAKKLIEAIAPKG